MAQRSPAARRRAEPITFVEEHDEEIDPLGVKCVGEIGIVGTVAAIASAICRATGIRVRDLPLTIDKLMRAASQAARIA